MSNHANETSSGLYADLITTMVRVLLYLLSGKALVLPHPLRAGSLAFPASSTSSIESPAYMICASYYIFFYYRKGK